MDGGERKSSRKPRADAARNRERLIAAAGDIFSAGGPDASLEKVAKAAGLGIGTLYRHFPTREGLFLAVYEHEVDDLVRLAERQAAAEDPVAALRRFMQAGIRMVAAKRGMLAALSPILGDQSAFFDGTRTRLTGAIAALLDRGVAAGRLRDDVGAEEVLRAFLGICYASDAAGWQASAIRLLDVFVDGLTRPV